jgi:hypothetical protein
MRTKRGEKCEEDFWCVREREREREKENQTTTLIENLFVEKEREKRECVLCWA